jgi:hypothetical protein
MSDEPRELPVIRWTPGMKVPLPEGHVPSYVEVGPGEVIDEALLRWILDALLDEHSEAERLRLVAATRPGLDAEPGELHGEPMVAVRLVGEVIGYFDPRLLKA